MNGGGAFAHQSLPALSLGAGANPVRWVSNRALVAESGAGAGLLAGGLAGEAAAGLEEAVDAAVGGALVGSGAAFGTGPPCGSAADAEAAQSRLAKPNATTAVPARHRIKGNYSYESRSCPCSRNALAARLARDVTILSGPVNR